MRKLAAVLMVVVAFASYADKTKTAKTKDKRFEAVLMAPGATAGSYRGPSESYGLVIEQASNGLLYGNYVEMGRVAVLNDIRIHGAAFTASASFDDGSHRTITGSFANRVLNGQRAFGVRLTGIPVEDMGAIDTFFEKIDAAEGR